MGVQNLRLESKPCTPRHTARATDSMPAPDERPRGMYPKNTGRTDDLSLAPLRAGVSGRLRRAVQVIGRLRPGCARRGRDRPSCDGCLVRAERRRCAGSLSDEKRKNDRRDPKGPSRWDGHRSRYRTYTSQRPFRQGDSGNNVVTLARCGAHRFKAGWRRLVGRALKWDWAMGGGRAGSRPAGLLIPTASGRASRPRRTRSTRK